VIALVASSSASAAVVSNERFQMVETEETLLPCVPEPITIYADVHIVVTESIDQRGAGTSRFTSPSTVEASARAASSMSSTTQPRAT
jgi:hypothetical protein